MDTAKSPETRCEFRTSGRNVEYRMLSSGSKEYSVVSKKTTPEMINFSRLSQEEGRQRSSDDCQQQNNTENNEHNESKRFQSMEIDESLAYNICHNIISDGNKVSDDAQLHRLSPNTSEDNKLSSTNREKNSLYSKTVEDGSGEGRQPHNGDRQQRPTLDVDEPDIFECSNVFVQHNQSQSGIVDDIHFEHCDTNSAKKIAKNDYSGDCQLNHKYLAAFNACKQRSSNDSGESFKLDDFIWDRRLKRSPEKYRQSANDDCQEVLASSKMDELDKFGTFARDYSLSGKIDKIHVETSCDNSNKSPDFDRLSILVEKQRALNDYEKSGSHFKLNDNTSTTRLLMFSEKKQVISNKYPAVSFVSSKPSNDAANNHTIGSNMCDLNNLLSADSGATDLDRSKIARVSNGFKNSQHFARIDSCTSPVLPRKKNDSASACTSRDRTTLTPLKESIHDVSDIVDDAPQASLSALVKYYENISSFRQKSHRETTSQNSIDSSAVEWEYHPRFFKKYPCSKVAKSDVDYRHSKEYNSHLLLACGPDESCSEKTPIVKKFPPLSWWIPLEESMVPEEEGRSSIIKMTQVRIPHQIAWRLQKTEAKSIYPNIIDTSDNLSDQNNPNMHVVSNIFTQKTVPQNSDNLERNTGKMLLASPDMVSEQIGLKTFDNTDKFPEEEDQNMFDAFDHFQDQTVSEIIGNSNVFQETGDFHPEDKISGAIENGLREIPVQPLVNEARSQKIPKYFFDHFDYSVYEIIDNSKFLQGEPGKNKNCNTIVLRKILVQSSVSKTVKHTTPLEKVTEDFVVVRYFTESPTTRSYKDNPVQQQVEEEFDAKQMFLGAIVGALAFLVVWSFC